MKQKLEGIWAPTATALTRDGRVDQEEMKRLVDFLVQGGVDGLLPLGTSGEFALLTREERRRVLEAVVEQTDGRVPVFAGVSDPSLENVLGFAKDAKEVGADGIIATPPYYFTTGGDGLFDHFETIARKGDLPLMIYNIPEWTHVLVPPEIVWRLAEKQLIVGMKYTEYNLLNLLRFLEVAKSKISIFAGSDAMALTNLEFGGSGGIIGVANVVPKLASSVFDEFQKGNLDSARKAQVRLLPIIEAIGIGGFPAGLKEAMKMVGMPVGEVKHPLQPLSDGEKGEVRRLLVKAGIGLGRE